MVLLGGLAGEQHRCFHKYLFYFRRLFFFFCFVVRVRRVCTRTRRGRDPCAVPQRSHHGYTTLRRFAPRRCLPFAHASCVAHGTCSYTLRRGEVEVCANGVRGARTAHTLNAVWG